MYLHTLFLFECLKYTCALFEILFISAPVCTTYQAIVSKNMACFADVLYQVFTSKKVDYIFSKSKLLIKTLFRIMG